LLSLNEAFDRRSVDLLLALDKLKEGLLVSGDGVLTCAPLIASDMVQQEPIYREVGDGLDASYEVALTNKGRAFVHAWKRGDQAAAVKGDA
jgi:hypothetical protein